MTPVIMYVLRIHMAHTYASVKVAFILDSFSLMLHHIFCWRKEESKQPSAAAREW